MNGPTVLSGAYDVSATSLWGLLATGVLTLLMAVSQGLGWSRMSIPFMIGSMFTSKRTRAMAFGITLHFCVGLAFAHLYAFAFVSWEWATWWLGALLGLFHALFVLIVGIPTLPEIHPRMGSEHHGPSPTLQLEPPGFMALNYGRNTPAITLVAHVAYGILLAISIELPIS